MAVKLFILGLPGSGKSTISNHIANYVKERQWSSTHIYDYHILFQMFEEDTKGQFRSIVQGGFDVLDLDVFDIALRKLEQEVNGHLSTSKFEEIIFIEFSRNNYEQAFRIFNQAILKDAYFLHLDVDLEICKQRVHKRATKPDTSNNHYVSEYIFDTYYFGDDGIDLSRILEGNCGVDNLKVKVINNNVAREGASNLKAQFEEIEQFIDYIILRETLSLPETEPIPKIRSIETQGEFERNR